MKKTMITMVAIFLGVLVLFVYALYRSTMDIESLAFIFAMSIYLFMYFTSDSRTKNSKLVNMRGFGMSNSFNYNSELIASDIMKLESKTGGIPSTSSLSKWFLFAMGTFYFAVCVVCGFVA